MSRGVLPPVQALQDLLTSNLTVTGARGWGGDAARVWPWSLYCFSAINPSFENQFIQFVFMLPQRWVQVEAPEQSSSVACRKIGRGGAALSERLPHL